MARSREEILQQLEAHRESLVLSGSVHYRPDRKTFVLRFRERTGDGRRINRSISIGSDEDMAKEVMRLIEQWRKQSPLGLTRAQRQLIARSSRLVDSSDLSLVQKTELKRDIRRQVQAGNAIALTDALLIALNAQHMRTNPHGRPTKGALW